MSLGEAFRENLADLTRALKASPRGGLSLGEEFSRAYNAAAGKAAWQAQNEALLGLKSGSMTGLIDTNGNSRAKQEAMAERERKVASERADTVLFLALLDWIQADIQALEAQLQQNANRLQRLNSYENALDEYIEKAQAGTFEVNADGSLKDETAEAAILEFEDKYGITVDRKNIEQVQLVLEKIKEERIELVRSNAEIEREIDQRQDLLNDPDSLVAYAQNLNNEEQARILNGAQTDLESRELYLDLVEARNFSQEGQEFHIDAFEGDSSAIFKSGSAKNLRGSFDVAATGETDSAPKEERKFEQDQFKIDFS